MAFNYRSPQTTQERRKSQEHEDLIRPARNIRNLPDAYDDRPCDGKHSDYKRFRRWLKRQLGRHWDDVYSDICRKFDEDVREWIEWLVETDTYMVNGIPYNKHGYLVGSYYRSPLYLNPETGILCEAKKQKRVQEPKPLTKIEIEPGVEYRKINGVWYYCTIRTKVLFRWGYPIEVEVLKKRQLNKKELRKLGLRNN